MSFTKNTLDKKAHLLIKPNIDSISESITGEEATMKILSDLIGKNNENQ